MTKPDLADAPARLFDLMLGSWIAQAVGTAADLGVADALADGPRHVRALAAELDADPDALYRLLRALITVGIVTEKPGRGFESTELARSGAGRCRCGPGAGRWRLSGFPVMTESALSRPG
ncbi:methyltransferase dimerization domain-containing protein [Nocardia sp. NPDC050406]|uniref:methyltransferase family protein n=1 Tax=Nocardia sp. NPDC050406 TaxID=3364318 RepID=UPI0037874B02